MTDTDAHLKLQWAWHHFENLQAILETFERSYPYQVAFERNPEQTEYIYTARVIVSEPRIALALGDFVHCARASIDQLVYAIALKKRRRVPHKTGFPIFRTEDDFICKGKPMVAPLPPAARAAIEEMQPYKRTDTGARLAVLHALWNMDKHRQIPIVGMFAGLPQIEVTRGKPADIGTPRIESEKKNETIVRIPIHDPDVQINPKFSLYIGFGKGSAKPIPIGRSVEETLLEIHHVIRDEVFPRLTPFL